ncbi:MAG: hypothetical protein HOA08_09620, partial [Rhodospirillaceae bacterium]|nr:hypothetical protein [Rhodospirillaceae bacterium]
PDKTGIKILLNLILIANDTIPRGGQVHVALTRASDSGKQQHDRRSGSDPGDGGR